MTEKEIIEALKRCPQHIECCYCNSLDECGNKRTLTTSVLDLIIHQKAEIERLEKELELANADKVIAEMHEKSAKEMFVDVTQQIKIAKSEAIKEFAEMLQNYLYNCDVVGDRDNIGYITSGVHRTIDNLVKEMTEVEQ